jgi:hypothetical protein
VALFELQSQHKRSLKKPTPRNDIYFMAYVGSFPKLFSVFLCNCIQLHSVGSHRKNVMAVLTASILLS